jgi:tRNA-dihydrouridine synthase B
MKIGSIDIDKPLALAPMEDVSDIPFRQLCKEQGADLVYTEFTSCEALVRNVKSSLRKIQVLATERPIAVQLYGSAEETMEEAARIAESMRPDFIDINCGCWVKKIAMRGDGAGLLRDLKKFEAVVQAVQRGTTLPVTVKTRLGWDHENIVILDVARMLEANGVAALTVHCRTRTAGYSGEADWTWLPRIKAATSIPIIANGDIVTPQDVKQVFDTGCDGAMIGRGAIQNPWIFGQAKHYLATGTLLPEPRVRDRISMCIRHLTASAEYRGEQRGVTSFRKHYSAYLKGMHNAHKFRVSLMGFTEVAPIVERLHEFAGMQEEQEGIGAPARMAS